MTPDFKMFNNILKEADIDNSFITSFSNIIVDRI